MTFNGHRLLFNIMILSNNIYVPKKVINLYISNKIGPQLENLNTYFTLGNCLLASGKLIKNPDLDKYKYSNYGIGFDSRSEFLLPDGTMGKNAVISGADMSSSLHVHNTGKYTLILGEGPTQGLDDTTLTAEARYLNSFTQSGKRFVLSLHCNGGNSFLFVNATKVCQFKAKNSRIKDYALCLGNVSKDFTINNMKKSGLKGVVTFFLLISILLILKIF